MEPKNQIDSIPSPPYCFISPAPVNQEFILSSALSKYWLKSTSVQRKIIYLFRLLSKFLLDTQGESQCYKKRGNKDDYRTYKEHATIKLNDTIKEQWNTGGIIYPINNSA